MVKYQIQIGNGVLSFENADPKIVHRFGAVYGALPAVCDACGSKRIHLSFKNPGGNDYYLLRCSDCGAELNLHQKKEGGFFIKNGEKMAVYVPKNDESGSEEKKAETPKNANIHF